MPLLDLDAKKTLYDPVKIKFKGKVFPVKKINRDDVRKIREYDLKAMDGDLEAAYARLELFIGKHKVINTLTIEELIEITQFIVENLFNPPVSEKNVPPPGDVKSP